MTPDGSRTPDQQPTYWLPPPAPTLVEPAVPVYRRGRSRHLRFLVWGGSVVGALVLLVGIALWALRPESVAYLQYENEYFAIDYPRGWAVFESDEEDLEDLEDPMLAQVSFRDPFNDRQLAVEYFHRRYVRSSSGELRLWDSDLREDYADYDRIDFDRFRNDQTPDGWDVAYHECTYVNPDWPTPERHRFHQVITIDETDVYSIYMIVPANEAFSYRQIRAELIDSLRPFI